MDGKKQLPDDVLSDIGTDTVLAMMRSADPEVIRPVDWWVRAKSALTVAAAVAETWSQFISKMGDKLQIVVTNKATADKINIIGMQLVEFNSFERFRFLCQRDALYIVAMAQAKRTEEREAAKQP